jgi:hypothetical protein
VKSRSQTKIESVVGRLFSGHHNRSKGSMHVVLVHVTDHTFCFPTFLSLKTPTEWQVVFYFPVATNSGAGTGTGKKRHCIVS